LFIVLNRPSRVLRNFSAKSNQNPSPANT
jgi:hypothetical protein